MGGAMKPLCYPVLDERGLHVVTQNEHGELTRSHTLTFAECRNMVEKSIEAMQRLYVDGKCKCG
jgi:hypothetical protein